MAKREKIYIGHPSTIDWLLKAGRPGAVVPVGLGSVTKMTAEIAGVTVDSNTAGNGEGNPFYWLMTDPAIDSQEPNLFLRFGGVLDGEGIAEGIHTLRLTVFDPDHPDGFVWIEEKVKIIV